MSKDYKNSTPENILGDTIRALLKERGMKAFELGEEIGLSPTSVSKIINGASRPRQNTFTRMCKALCQNKDDELRLVSAFAGTELLEEEPYQALPSSNKEILRLRTEQFMERKTQSIQFKRSVARELDKLGLSYKQDYCEGIYSTDFLIEKDGKRIALECKANIDRDIEKTVAQADMVMSKLGFTTFVVAPYITGISELQTKGGVKIFPLSELSKHF